MSDKTLSLVEDEAPATPAAPRQRGRLMSSKMISEELYSGIKAPWWVNHYFAPEYKIKQGRDNFWWEADAHAWLDAQRKVAS